MTYAAAPFHSQNDRLGLLALWMEVMASRATSAIAEWRLSWFFDQNPVGAPTSCVTHHVESQSVVACGSAHPRNTQVGSKTHLAGILSDFAVSKQHRTAGAAMMVQRRLTAESLSRFDFIYGCPNKEAEPIFKRLKFHEVGVAVSFSRLLRTRAKIAKRIPSETFAGIAGYVVDQALAVTDSRVLLKRIAYRVDIVERADSRFDDLWHRARKHFGITGERTASYLNWRYADFKTSNLRFFTLTKRRNRELAGYIVFTIKEDVVHVEDFFCDEPTRMLEAMFVIFTSKMRSGKHRSIYLNLLANQKIEASLRRALFVKRSPVRRLIVKTRDGLAPDVVRRLEDGQEWFMVGGELDT